jgi:hypothetical protein
MKLGNGPNGPLEVVAYYRRTANLYALGPWYGDESKPSDPPEVVAYTVRRRPRQAFSASAHSGTWLGTCVSSFNRDG